MSTSTIAAVPADRPDEGLRVAYKAIGTTGDYELELQLTPEALDLAEKANPDFEPLDAGIFK